MRYITEIYVHCSASKWGNALAIDSWHRKRGFDEIGYNYVILNGKPFSNVDYNDSLDGIVETGRDEQKIPAHAKGHNKKSIGICLVGNEAFTPKEITSLLRLIGEIKKRHPIEKVLGHYEVCENKTCPNLDMDELRREMK